MTDYPSTYLQAEQVRSELLWAVAAESCEFVGITFTEMLDRTLSDKFPADERVESVCLAFGPPILRELALILTYIEDLKREAAKEALARR